MSSTRSRWLLMAAMTAMAALAGLAYAVPQGLAATSGETSMGYDWIDNKGPSPSIIFQWFDIATSGTRLATLSDCDDCVQAGVPIGFGFPIYGDSFNSTIINSNGTLQFEDTADHWGPGRMPTPDFAGPVLLPFWSDWDPRSSGDIYVQSLADWPGSGGQRAFVVQWQNVENWDCGRGNNATWQAVLLEDGSFIFQYLDTMLGDPDCDRGIDMTVGIQQDTQGCFISYSNQFVGVPDRTAISWSPQSSSCVQAPPTATEMASSSSPTPLTGPNATGSGGPSGLPNDGSGPSPSARDSAAMTLAMAGAALLVGGLAVQLLLRRKRSS